MGIFWLAPQYEQCLAPTKERVKTWDNDTEFGLALVDRQFDNMFDEAHVFFDRPPTDRYGKDPDKNWYASLYLRTARDLSLEVPLEGGATRTVTMGAGTKMWFSMSMIRVQNRPSASRRRGRVRRGNWRSVKQARFEVSQSQVVLYLVEILADPEVKWSYTSSDRVIDENTWDIQTGSWDCVQNYRSHSQHTVGDGRQLRSSQPRFKTLKALGVSMWSIVMSHAAHGDGFDGRVGIDAAQFYQRDWNITADDDWCALGDIERNEGGFECEVCNNWCDSEEDYYGTHNGMTWCWDCVNEHRSACEWCETDVWDDEDEVHMVKLLGSRWEVAICSDCYNELEECDGCGGFNDTRENPPLPELTYSVYIAYYQMWRENPGLLCPDCANEKGWYKCEDCGEWFSELEDGCDMEEFLCVECSKERKGEEAGCDSTECASSVSGA